MPAGRPTDFKPEYTEQVEKLAKVGMTDVEIADFFDVSVRTLHRWKASFPEFCHSLKVAKEEADSRVERSLFQRATGYETDSVKIFMPAGASEPVYAPFRENVQPDTTACIFWLKNRKSQEWREKSEVEVTTNLAELIAEGRKRL